jgi:hypothetical protein
MQGEAGGNGRERRAMTLVHSKSPGPVVLALLFSTAHMSRSRPGALFRAQLM